MIPFKFLPKGIPERVQNYIGEEVDRILPDLKRLAKLFWEANWGAGTHDKSPQVGFTIDLGFLPKNDGSGRNWAFSLEFYSDAEDEIIVYAQSFSFSRDGWNIMGKAKTKPGDWFNE